MSCVEKRLMNHRVGSMLHHRFPNGFTDLFMDETDREVSTLTDRAFRSLCVGDDAVYNDDFLYGYSPFSCHKPLVGEPLKKTHHRDSKKHGQSKNEKSDAQPWKQQQKKNISQMSSFLKALSATEESCEGMLIKNGGMTDSNGESWDKSALRSIQRELSEFSSDYHTTLTDRHYKNQHRHQSNDGSANKASKDANLPSGKSSKTKNSKTSVKLKKLNIKNFFLHSEFSPFQTWTDFNRFPFGQEDAVASILPGDNIPKWYDLPFYKELTEAHRKDILEKKEFQPRQKAAAESSPPPPPPPPAQPSVFSPPKPTPPLPPPKVLPKPSAPQTEKRCTSEGLDVSAAPWRRNKSRAKSTVPVNLPGTRLQESISKTTEEGLLYIKKEAKSVEVKAIEEVSSLASTPFSICQLMTPLIPSRQPTETSEILQGVFSPLALDLPLRPQSEAKVTPEPPVKRDGYKALASSILFNLKDNRKRVKSRYSPPKFKTLDLLESGAPSPQSDHVKSGNAGSEGNASGLSTPAILKEGATVFSPIVEPDPSPNVDCTKPDADKPLSDDYLLSNLLQTKKDASGHSALGEDGPISPFIQSKKNKSPMVKKQNYPSLKLYKKANPVDNDTTYLQVPLSISSPAHKDPSPKTYDVSPLTLNKNLSPKALSASSGLSPNTLNVTNDSSTASSPHVLEKEGQSFAGKRPQNVADKLKRAVKDEKEKDFESQLLPKEREISGQPMSTMDVIRAAREAINAAKSKARSDSINKPMAEVKDLGQKEIDENVSKELEGTSAWETWAPESSSLSPNKSESTLSGRDSNARKEPPPVPKRNFAKSDIQLALDKQQMQADRVSNGEDEDATTDLPLNENKSVKKQSKPKHLFSARQNNYIKHQRYAVADDLGEDKEGHLNVNTGLEMDDITMPLKELRDSELIINDLLEKARLGDRAPENAKQKLAAVDAEEEVKAKNDLISRELRNIKRGMLSMRGNTSSKREMFTKKEQEQSKQEGFLRLDNNVVVNKALINDNYDKAKMALEEIISEREKRKCRSAEQDEKFDDSVGEESHVTRIQRDKKAIKDSLTEVSEKQNVATSALKEKDLKDRLVDLRDHNQMRQILSQTEPRGGETHRAGRTALPGMDIRGTELNALLKSKATSTNGNPSHATARQTSDESGEYSMNESDSKKTDAPPIPPRSKKGGGRASDESIAMENDAVDENVAHKNGKREDRGVNLNDAWTISGIQQPQVEEVASQSETASYHEKWNLGSHPKSDQASLNSSYTPSENTPCLSPEISANSLQIYSPTSETSSENSSTKAQETSTIKRRAPLKPDHLTWPENIPQTSVAEEPNAISRTSEDTTVEGEALDEAPRHIISPLLLVNGLSINQSPPDQASSSSKSSYFSVESALQRNIETESVVYHSLENLAGELEQVEDATRNASQNTQQGSERTDPEYYSLSDHENEPEVVERPVKSPQKEPKVAQINSGNKNDPSLVQDGNAATSLTNTFSPTLGIPALFKVKDNTFTNKLKKTVQPWSPRGSLGGAGKVEEDESHQVKKNPELLVVHENPSITCTLIPPEVNTPEEMTSNSFPSLQIPPSDPQQENSKSPYAGGLLTVPLEDDRSSGVSPLSEGVESLTTSAADTADEMAGSSGGLAENEGTKVLSERSGSTCSGNDSQSGLLKPPAVLPKSEKAVLKAIKLANRRMKKEEAHKSSQKSSQGSSKHRSDKHKSEKSEHKSSSGGKSSRSSEKKHKEKSEGNHRHGEIRGNEQPPSNEDNRPRNQTETIRKTRRQSYDSMISGSQRGEELLGAAPERPERQGRASNRHARERPEPRHYSSDRIISNVPVYKAQMGEQQASSDKSFHRTQSIDRYMGDKTERRFSADMSANEKLDPRAQRIEKSIMDEFQQRGRARDKPSRENPLRRSHSIDAYSTDAPHPSSLSRQSSYTSQLSRQSSIEHAIVQSFPLTQRKLLQDPDSGQYFFVDMPVQVKTKTFFDPETGSYVQLPVQPAEGAVPQASPIEVLSPPMVLYRGFVPVPLSPMAQKAPVQAPCKDAKEFEQRHLERSRQMHCKEGQPYLEPVYGQRDLMLGEFMGTEELDCPR